MVHDVAVQNAEKSSAFCQDQCCEVKPILLVWTVRRVNNSQFPIFGFERVVLELGGFDFEED